MSDPDLIKHVRTMDNDALLQVINSKGTILFGKTPDYYKKLCIEELKVRGFDTEKIKTEFERLKTRSEQPLELTIKITNILLPFNHFFEDDINRFYKHGYRKKINQNIITKFIGFVLWFFIVIIFIIITRNS